MSSKESTRPVGFTGELRIIAFLRGETTRRNDARVGVDIGVATRQTDDLASGLAGCAHTLRHLDGRRGFQPDNTVSERPGHQETWASRERVPMRWTRCRLGKGAQSSDRA